MQAIWWGTGWRRRVLLSGTVCAFAVGLAGCPDSQSTAVQHPRAATAPDVASAQTASAAPAPAQVSSAELARQAEQQRKVQQLVQLVDRSFQSGVANYRARKLDAARLDFDFAVDLMLTSGIDIKTDPVLSDAFERTVDAVNALELDALKQGNGFSPPVEASPLEAAGDLTFGASPELTARLAGELSTASDLPLVINDQVAGYINAFSHSPSFQAHMVRSLERAGKYGTMIRRVLKEEGVPQDLIYLAVAESGFQPQAMNAKSGAGGMWQFMPTGAYGLARNGYYDERFDPEKSSRAYARYMKGLYNQFGDWYLAMAAYDWGPGNVQRAVMRTGYADYWQLLRRNAMPRETKAYVPQILAAVIMAKNPSKYGLDRAVPEPAVQFDTVGVDYALDLRLAADVTNTTVANIVTLNPALLRLQTPRDGHYDLHIPAGTLEDFNTRIKPIPEEKRASWRFHEMRAGESLEQVATSYKVPSRDILLANGLAESDAVSAGDELVIPLAVSSSASGSHPLVYVPRRGDTLVTVADRFNVTAEQLRQWNRLKSGALRPGKAVFVAEPVRLAPHGRSARRGRSAKVGHSAARSRSARASSVRRGGSVARHVGSRSSSSHARSSKPVHAHR